jgi:release factor glutamine methyltransferase
VVAIKSILADMRNAFRAIGLDTPELDARLLVEAALDMTQTDLLTNADQEITRAQETALEAMTLRRLQREPVSRILGTRAFWKSDFKISPATLDPRADSETLVEAVLKHFPLSRSAGEGRGEGASLRERSCGETPSPSPLRGSPPSPAERAREITILDMGTGTGFLLLSLLQELPQATGTGIDISAEAVEIARENALALALADRVEFMKKDWKEIGAFKTFDIVISNPPYITLDEIKSLEPEVRAYDPLAALSGGADGLDCYRDIAVLLPRLLKPDGLVFFEIGSTQAEAVKGIVGKAGLTMLHTYIDLAGHDRCLVARYTARPEIL